MADRAAIARTLAEASLGTEPVEATEQACRIALELYEAAGDEQGAGWAHAWTIFVMFLAGREEEARQHADIALSLLEPLGDTRELAEAFRQRGQLLWRVGEMQDAQASSRRAAEIAKQVGALDIEAAAMQDLGVELSYSGRTEEALATMEDAFRLAKVAGDRINLQRMHNNMASTLTDFASDLPRAKQIAEEGLEMARRAGGTGWSDAWIEGTLGGVEELLLGNLEAGEAWTRASLQDAELRRRRSAARRNTVRGPRVDCLVLEASRRRR